MSGEKTKAPSFQFYPGDWLHDSALRLISVGARGLWIDMMCVMHQSEPYGYLKVNHKVILPVNLARIVGLSLPETEGYLSELEEAGVFSRDADGAIYSRRMVRDEELRQKRRAGGTLGGNPNLTRHHKDNQKDNHKDNQKVKQIPTPSSSSSSSSSTTDLNSSNIYNHVPNHIYIPDNTAPEIKPKSFSVIATPKEGETYRPLNSAKPQIAESIELEPIQPGCKHFRAAELEIEQAKIYAHNRNITGDYVGEAIAVVDGWLQSDEPKPKAARRQPSHGRYLTASWVVDNVLRARKAIANQQTAGGRQSRPKTIHEKNAEFFEKFERENGLTPEPAQMVDVGTNVDDVEIIYPEE